jgi:hypothetical protein
MTITELSHIIIIRLQQLLPRHILLTCSVEPIHTPDVVITKVTRYQCIKPLVQRVNHLFINRPCPRQRARSCGILHHLVHHDPNPRVQKARERSDDSIVRENSANSAGYHAHAIVMDVVQQVDVAVIELGRYIEVISNGTCRYVGCGSVSDELLEPICAEHGEGADEASSDAYGNGGTEPDFGEGGEG